MTFDVKKTSEKQLESPCVDICILDDRSGMCVGCGRTGDEIARWTSMSPEQRRALMESLPQRLKQLEATAKSGGAAS